MFEVNESVSDTRDIKEEEEEEVRTASSREERGDAKHRQHQKCRSEAQTRIRRVNSFRDQFVLKEKGSRVFPRGVLIQ